MSAMIETASYKISPEKVSVMRHGQRQIVTGLVVNEKLRPTKSFIVDLKYDIQLCLVYGPKTVADAEGITVGKLKRKLNGRIAHLRRFDAVIARHFHRMMYGVNWITGFEFA